MITALDSLDCKADFADWAEGAGFAPGTGVRSAYPGGDWGLGADAPSRRPSSAARWRSEASGRSFRQTGSKSA
jgi:hypothetical protein